MKVLLGFHFRDDGIRRGEIFRRIRPIVEGLYPWSDVWVRDSGHDPYSRAASRNLIVREAEKSGFDVVVINDADSIPQSEALETAISRAYHNREIVVPFDNVHVLAVNNFFVRPDRYETFRPLYKYGTSFGGVYVTTPQTWAYVGGMDERVIGWGFEDQIILSAVHTFLHGPVYVPGILFNVNHPRDTSSLKIESNDRLIREYHAAQGKIDEFRALQLGSNAYFA